MRKCQMTRWRSIPACAGEAPAMNASRNATKVYPRVCGGSPGPEFLALLDGGLSPRVRGKHGPTETNG